MAAARTYLLIGLVWLVVATAACAAGLPARLPMPFPQVLLATLTVLLLGAFGWNASFRRWLLALDLRALLLIHLSRLVGAYFIAVYFRSELPYAFAIPAGVGDLIAITLATPLPFISAQKKWGRITWLAWNSFGLADILFVVATAARIGLANPDSMAAMTRLPLGLLPTFIVPLIVFSHVVIFVRLLRPSKGST